MAKKEQPIKPPVVYADVDTPLIDFADFVRLSVGPHGVLFEFGQNQPFENKAAITHQIIVPHVVATRFYDIFGAQMEKFNGQVTETIQSLNEGQE